MKRITVSLATMLLALAMMSPAWSGGSSDRQSSDGRASKNTRLRSAVTGGSSPRHGAGG